MDLQFAIVRVSRRVKWDVKNAQNSLTSYIALPVRAYAIRPQNAIIYCLPLIIISVHNLIFA